MEVPGTEASLSKKVVRKGRDLTSQITTQGFDGVWLLEKTEKKETSGQVHLHNRGGTSAYIFLHLLSRGTPKLSSWEIRLRRKNRSCGKSRDVPESSGQRSE